MSARRGSAWRKGGPNALLLTADRKRGEPPTVIRKPAAGHVRVAIFTPAEVLAQTRSVEVVDGAAFVDFDGVRLRAEPCAVVPETGGARYRVTMPARATEPEPESEPEPEEE